MVGLGPTWRKTDHFSWQYESSSSTQWTDQTAPQIQSTTSPLSTSVQSQVCWEEILHFWVQRLGGAENVN